jgi:hypothetical protein
MLLLTSSELEKKEEMVRKWRRRNLDEDELQIRGFFFLTNHVAPNLVGVGKERGNGAEMEKKKFR